MKILDALQKEAILVNLNASDKKGVLDELATPVARIVNQNKEDLVRVLIERERLGSTGIGGGVGIPHGKFKELKSLCLGFGLSREGVDFESIDGRPTHLFFLLVTPENSTGLHLRVLAKISRMLKSDEFKQRLLAALRDQTFFGVGQINQALRPLLEQLNERPFQKMNGSRRSLFEQVDQPALQPLPTHRYQIGYWREARANIDYQHVLAGTLNLSTADRFTHALAVVRSLPVHFVQDSLATPSQCQAAATAATDHPNPQFTVLVHRQFRLLIRTLE